MEKFNHILLKLLREANGFTQEAVCTANNLNQGLWSRWERGLARPADKMVDTLASIFKYPREFLLQQVFDISSGLIYHRKRASLLAGTRARLEAQARLYALDAAKICQVQGIVSNVVGHENRTASMTARALRDLWSMPPGPVPNFIELLERNGIVVLAFDFKTDLLDGFFLPVGDEHEYICIALNVNEAFTPDRQRFTLAHELGHAVLHRSEFTADCKTAEIEANAFAAEFLLPEAEVVRDLTAGLTLTRLRELKIKWRVSMAAIAHRAHELGIASDREFRTICYFLSANGYRKKEPEFGIVQEKASLIKSSINQLADRGVNLDDLLLLSPARLSKRYGYNQGDIIR